MYVFKYYILFLINFFKDNINDSEKVLKSYPNYWSSQKIKKTQYWWFKSVSNESDEINFNRKKKFSKNFQLETVCL